MATKQPGDSGTTPEGGSSAHPSVKDSAQQIWLAGLGAFAKAQEEGGKVFEALVKEGLGMQRKSQVMAEEKITEAASKMTNLAQGITEHTSIVQVGVAGVGAGRRWVVEAEDVKI